MSEDRDAAAALDGAQPGEWVCWQPGDSSTAQVMPTSHQLPQDAAQAYRAARLLLPGAAIYVAERAGYMRRFSADLALPLCTAEPLLEADKTLEKSIQAARTRGGVIKGTMSGPTKATAAGGDTKPRGRG
ncbi:MAG: hypothetical protein ACPGVG_10250 [Mycobacterium sp.]